MKRRHKLRHGRHGEMRRGGKRADATANGEPTMIKAHTVRIGGCRDGQRVSTAIVMPIMP